MRRSIISPAAHEPNVFLHPRPHKSVVVVDFQRDHRRCNFLCIERFLTHHLITSILTVDLLCR